MDDDFLARDPLPAEPFPVLRRWLDEAFATRDQANPHAFALATVGKGGAPAVRMVLCQEIDVARGAVAFFTNYESAKGRALAHPGARAAGAFHFIPTGRQGRVEGPVERLSAEASDAYFATRPAESQLGAWASAQSEPLASRDALLAAFEAQVERFGMRGQPLDRPADLPRPPHWGGLRLLGRRVELWKSRPGRLHDRAEWVREAEGAPWRIARLQP